MKPLLLILVAFFTSSVANSQVVDSSDPHAFSISSLNTAFGMQGDFEGKYLIYPDRVELWITKAEITISKNCPYKGRRLLSALKIGLATTTENKSWKIAHASDPIAAGQVMSPGETHQLGEFHLTIPVKTPIDLSSYWLVIQMEDNVIDVPDTSRMKGYAYAHSRRDIFKKPDSVSPPPDPLIR